MEAPVLIQDIPPQVVNELAAYGPFDLTAYFKFPAGTAFFFQAEINTGEALPSGMICTEDGMLLGIPGKHTRRHYDLIIHVSNEAGAIQAPLSLTIKPTPQLGDADYLDQLKAQVWEAVENNLPIPDLGEIYGQEITALEIYYLLERWGILKIWDAFNLEPPGSAVLLQLDGVSEHYHVYDRGSCLMMAPKDLFSHERTVADGIRTAQVMAGEVYRRGWTVELSGFDKYTKAAWIELQLLGDQYGKRVDVINYSPSFDEMKLYNIQAVAKGIGNIIE